MWSSGRDANEYGEPVLLLLPAATNDNHRRLRGRGDGGRRTSRSDPSSSHAGGHPSYHEGDARRPPSFPSTSSVVENDDDGDVPSSHSGTTNHPACTTCGGIMPLLLQLHAPVDEYDRTMYVFGCNNAPCHHPPTTGKNDDVGDGGEGDDGDAAASGAGVFRSWIGGGPVRCLRSQRRWTTSSKTRPPHDDGTAPTTSRSGDDGPIQDVPPTKVDSEDDDYWGADDMGDDGGWGNDDGEDDWGIGGGDAPDGADLSMDYLEAMMDDCEMAIPPSNGSKPRPSPSTKSRPPREKSDADDDAKKCGDAPPSFERIDLLTMNEPPSRRSGTSDDGDDEDVDDDDDGGCDDIDAKVERMLSRYLDAEDDEEILSALRGGPDAGRDGGSDAGGGGDGGGGERYERPPPEERAFLSFTRRLRRAPGQVARYAYGGSPLWSVPTSSPPSSGDGTSERRGHRGSGRERKEKFQKNKSQRNNHPSPLPAVPDCACGAGRVFEFQVLPSLLHVLDVDGYATVVGGREKKENDDDVFDLINSGGMNWGSIAIYSCSLSCDDSREEFVIVQEAVGDAPMRKNAEKGDDSGGDD